MVAPPTSFTRWKQRVARLKKFIKETDFVPLPQPDHCQVVVMPEFRRGNAVAYLEPAPPLDTNANAHLAISPPPADWSAAKVNSYLEEYNNHMLDILAIHEGYPGHAVQLAYANQNPSLIRRIFQSGAYVEGWAVYTEQAMLDQGYGDGDLALRLNQLKFYLRTVANAILDHKMHCGTMTDDQAMEFLTQEVSSPRARRGSRSSAPSKAPSSCPPTSSAAWRITGCGRRSSAKWGTSLCSAAIMRRCWPPAACP